MIGLAGARRLPRVGRAVASGVLVAPMAGGSELVAARFGPVPPDLIAGRVLARYWPVSNRGRGRFQPG
jgi:hypothetical protein